MSKNHFKLTDSEIFHSPVKIAIFIIVFATIILCTIVVIQIDINDNQNKSGVVISQAGQQDIKTNQKDLTNSYEKQIKDILNNYLTQRLDQEFQVQEFCQNLVNQTLEKILNLTVPVDYKEFHLKLVIMLDRENQNCVNSDENLDDEWNKLLKDYNFLSENN